MRATAEILRSVPGRGASGRAADARHLRIAAMATGLALALATISGIAVASYRDVQLVSTGLPPADFAINIGISPDGESVLYMHRHVSPFGNDIWRWKDGQTTLISTGPSYTQPTNPTYLAMNSDGSRVLFLTNAKLVPTDNDANKSDIYLRDGGTTTLVSTGPTDPNNTGPVDQAVFFHGASPDGQQVAFRTAAALVSEDTDALVDTYLRYNGTTQLLSASAIDNPNITPATATGPGGTVFDPVCGCLRVYFTTGESLTADDTDRDGDVYEWAAGVLRLVTPAEIPAESKVDATFLGASSDGSRVIFRTSQPLIAADQNFDFDIYAYVEGQLELVSGGAAGFYPDLTTFFAAMTTDGTRVAFTTPWPLVPEDDDADLDLYERTDGGVQLITTGPVETGELPHTAGTGSGYYSGSTLVFETKQPIDPTDVDDMYDVYTWNGSSATLLTTSDGGAPVELREISGDGAFVFVRATGGLVPEDQDTVEDVYRYAINVPGAPTLMSGSAAAVGNSDAALNGFSKASSFDGSAVSLISNDSLTEEDTETANVGLTGDVYRSVVLPGSQAAVPPGGSVSSGASATGSQPAVANVTSPVGGVVTITEAATLDTPPPGSGYSFLGQQLNIVAPPSNSGDPITIVIQIDGALLAVPDPDLTASSVAVFRNGVPVNACIPSADDPATPDPCVVSREALTGGDDEGDARITVLTSAASHWNVGVLPLLPGAPANVVAVRDDKQASVTWRAPSAGASPINSYKVTSAPGGKTATVGGTSTAATVTGLTNGTSYTFTVTATNANGEGAASAPSNAVTPGKLLDQKITFAKPASQTMLTPTLPVTATASSGLPVTLTSTSPTVCSVSGFVISLLAPGTCSITASQAGGDGVYKAANPVSRSFAISLAPQTITFDKPANQNLLASPLTVSATVPSGLPVTLASTSPTVCSVSGFDISLLTTGTCAITATQPGDGVYKAANPVSRTFTVSKAPQTITIPDPGPQSLLVPIVVLSPSASSGLQVTLSSTTTGVCTVSGTAVTLKKTGTCRIKGVQAGNATYLAAPAITLQIIVGP